MDTHTIVYLMFFAYVVFAHIMNHFIRKWITGTAYTRGTLDALVHVRKFQAENKLTPTQEFALCNMGVAICELHKTYDHDKYESKEVNTKD